ncbi:MAG TPA: transporter [Thermodesulfovibrionales bacterium]|nr:transporter [Thermodesulfovibrionales bacterium]
MRSLIQAFVLLTVVSAVCGNVHAQEQAAGITGAPCAGPSSLLEVIDRPTVSDSVCVVPQGEFVLEAGFQHATLRGPGGGRADNFPQAAFRVGLPGKNEFVLLPQDYTEQRVADEDSSGWSPLTIGIKHSLGYRGPWQGAVEALFTLRSGSRAFGSDGPGVAFNGIAAYSVSEEVGVALQLGVSSQTDPSSAGGRRFTAFLSNLVATWQPVSRLQFYGEIFGQTSSGPGKGAGYNFDGGIQYLITPFWEIDLGAGVRLIGDLGGFSHFFGAGMGFRF